MKKGDLNLSIQLIVVVVIAFVVLGLGLNFVRTQFGELDKSALSIQESVRIQILDDLRTGNKKLSFPVTNIKMERGKSSDEALGVKNINEGSMTYSITIEKLQKQGLPETDTGNTASWANEIIFFLDTVGSSSLGATESRLHPIRITAAPNSGGTYLFKLVINNLPTTSNPDPITPYDEKTFFVTVN